MGTIHYPVAAIHVDRFALLRPGGWSHWCDAEEAFLFTVTLVTASLKLLAWFKNLVIVFAFPLTEIEPRFGRTRHPEKDQS